MDKKTYKEYVEARAPRSPIVKNCTKAFFCGGFICCVAETLKNIYSGCLNVTEDDAGLLTSVSLIFVAILLTGSGVFDKLAKHAGAGTLVPITGFANAVASPAIDSRGEGMVMGVGAKIFTVAGPVLLYGIISGAVYGVAYWIIRLVSKA